MVEEIEEATGPADHRFGAPDDPRRHVRGLLKRTRAELHERFVRWAEATDLARDCPLEVEEVLGYHLEQAHRLRVGLGRLQGHGLDLGAARPTASARRAGAALERGDMPAAANLLRWGRRGLPQDPTPAAARLPGGRGPGRDGGRRPPTRTRGAGDTPSSRRGRTPRLASVARLERTRLAYLTGVGGRAMTTSPPRPRARSTRSPRPSTTQGLATAWRLLLNVRLTGCRFKEAERRRRQDRRPRHPGGKPAPREPDAPGPRAAEPARPDARARRDGALPSESLGDVAGDWQAEAVARGGRCRTCAACGSSRTRAPSCGAAVLIWRSWAGCSNAALVCLDAAPVALLADDPAGAEAELQWAFETLDAMGERNTC